MPGALDGAGEHQPRVGGDPGDERLPHPPAGAENADPDTAAFHGHQCEPGGIAVQS